VVSEERLYGFNDTLQPDSGIYTSQTYVPFLRERRKQTINSLCSSCVAKITPYLDSVAGQNNWKVDVQHPEKTLTVDTGDVSDQALIVAVQKAGFNAVTIS
jgi:copper chaperone